MYNELAQDYNANYRIGFYNLSTEKKEKIKKLMGDLFYEYYDVDSLADDLLSRPDVILTEGKDEKLQELKKECMAQILMLNGQDCYNDVTLCLDTERDDQNRNVIQTEAITGNFHKIKHLISHGSDCSLINLLALVKQKDEHTYQHLLNVSNYASMLGEELGLPKTEIEVLELGGLLYDVGKICLPDSILFNTTAKLSAEKFELMKHHVTVGICLIPEPYHEQVKDMVLGHHERLDGSGYPLGLRGDAIPYHAQIMAVLDSYDAITTQCSYQNAHSHEEAMTILNKLSCGPNPKLSRDIVNALDRAITNDNKKHQTK